MLPPEKTFAYSITQSIRILGLIFFLSLILWSCSKKVAVPTPPPAPPRPVLNAMSDIIIHYKLDKKAIQDTFNTSIDQALAMDMGDNDEGLEIKVKKLKPASVEFDKKSVLVILTIDVFVSKKTLISKINTAGQLELAVISNLDIDQNWNFGTKTDLAYFKWIKQPKVDLGLFKMPIETIANQIIKRYKADILKKIDANIKASFNLKNRIKETVALIETPIEMDTAIGGYMVTKTNEILLNEMRNTQKFTEGEVWIKATNTFTYRKPSFDPKKVVNPPFKWTAEIPDSSAFNVLTTLGYEDLNTQVRKRFENKTFTEGNKSVTVKSIHLFGTENRLSAEVDVKGSFNGTLIVSGTPVYDSLSNAVITKDLDVKVKTKNILHKAASWLMKGRIKDNFAAMLKFPLKEQIRDAQQNLDLRTKEIDKNYKTKLVTRLGSARVDHIYVSNEGLELILHVNAAVELSIFNFSTFGK